MSTERQKAANKLNAQKSTGPTSPEGKAKSSRNHLSHGFASSATVIAGEDPEEFKALLDGFTLEYQPQTQTEQILVEHMATNQWLSLRAFRLQGYAFLGEKLRSDDRFAIPKDLGLLIRYKTTADNAFLKAHNQLLKAQKEREKSPIGFEPQNPPAQSETESKTVPVARIEPDFPAASDPADTKFAFSAPELLKKVA